MKLLLIAHLLDVILPAFRSFALARLLPVDEFGLALVLVALFSFVETTSDVGLPQQALRIPESDAEARATLQTLNLARAFGLTLLVLAITPILVTLYHRADAWPAFACVAVSFTTFACFNLKIKQRSRHYAFGPEATTLVAAQIAWTVATLATGAVLENHNAASIGVLAYTVAYALVSNLAIGRPFSLGWKSDVAREAWAFSAPLLPNGLMRAFTGLADRLFVASMLGLEAIAIYGPLITLLMLPRGAVSRFLTSLAQPRFLGTRTPEETAAIMRRWTALLSLTGAAFCLGFMALGQETIRLAFGARYAPSQALVTLTGLLAFARIVIFLPVPQAIAAGITSFLTITSTIQAVSMVLAVLALKVSPSLETFLGILSICETCGVALTIWRTERRFGGGLLQLFFTVGLGFVPCLLFAFVIHVIGLDGLLDRTMLGIVLGLITLGALRSGLPLLRPEPRQS